MERIEKKIDKILDKLVEIEVQTTKNTCSLLEHMRRSDNIEKMVELVREKNEKDCQALQQSAATLATRISSAEAFQNKMLGAVAIITPLATAALNYFLK